MCLSDHFPYHKDSVIGYAVVEKRKEPDGNKYLYWPAISYYGDGCELGKKTTAIKISSIPDDRGERYPLGFHGFFTLGHAMYMLRSFVAPGKVIVKAKFENVHTKGCYFGYGDSFVADHRTIIKEVRRFWQLFY